MKLPGFVVRNLSASDAPVLQALFETDLHYFQIVQGSPPASDEAKTLFADLPPGKGKEDKFVYGAFDDAGDLAAVLDVVRGYPEPQIWYLGLIFVAPPFRGSGLGSRLIDALCDHVHVQGAQTLRLAVVRTNARARALYDRRGFHFVVERERVVASDFRVMVDVMDRPV